MTSKVTITLLWVFFSWLVCRRNNGYRTVSMVDNIVTDTSKKSPFKRTMSTSTQYKHLNPVIFGNSCDFCPRTSLVCFRKYDIGYLNKGTIIAMIITCINLLILIRLNANCSVIFRWLIITCSTLYCPWVNRRSKHD